MEKADVPNRSQFICNAVKYYHCYLDRKLNTEVLTPAFETVIDARLDLTEYRLSQIIFKLAFEMAATMNILVLIFDDESSDEPIILSVPETEPEPDDDELDYRDYSLTSSEKYWKAKQLLDKNSKKYDFEEGFALLKLSAAEGNQYAQYKLGRMLIANE